MTPKENQEKIIGRTALSLDDLINTILILSVKKWFDMVFSYWAEQLFFFTLDYRKATERYGVYDLIHVDMDPLKGRVLS